MINKASIILTLLIYSMITIGIPLNPSRDDTDDTLVSKDIPPLFDTTLDDNDITDGEKEAQKTPYCTLNDHNRIHTVLEGSGKSHLLATPHTLLEAAP